MALMENPTVWKAQPPWDRDESSRNFQPISEPTTILQESSAFRTAALFSPAGSQFSQLLGHRELMLAEGQTLPKSSTYAATLPVEILCFIFEILAARRDACGLRSSASTCRLWADVALPVLYRHCGFGVFEYVPPQPYRKQNSYAAVPYSDFPFLKGRPLAANPHLVLRQACYWRTLLLSCFWKDGVLVPGNNPTLYPYLQYVENLDLLVLALVVTRYHAHRYRVIRNALFGIGTRYEGTMTKHFGSTQDVGFGILSRMFNVLLPRISHLKSANLFVEDDVTGSHAWPDRLFAKTIIQPMLETVGRFSRIVNLEICGQENLTPAFGKAIKALRPSLISPDNKTINKSNTFSLRITGARRIWDGVPDPHEELHRNRGFLVALNENSVTLVDFDISEDWGWDLDYITEFFLRQARTLKAIRLRGIGDTVGTWQLLDRMGRRGCRVRALDLENRHVHHPPVIFEPTAWAFKTGILKKLKYLAVENFQGITNSATNYHMIDPTSFSILLKHNLFGGRSTGNRLTPPIKTLVLTRTTTGSKVPEQIGAFVMHLAPTLTTLEIGYVTEGSSTEQNLYREQGRYKFIEVLTRLTQLKRLKAVGYAAEILVCACITPTEGSAVDEDVVMGDVSRPRSPARPSTPVGHSYGLGVEAIDMDSSNFHNSLTLSSASQYDPIDTSGGSRSSPYTRTPPAFRLFTSIWKNTLEELELTLSTQCVFKVHGGPIDDTLSLFTQLQKVRILTLLFGKEESVVAMEEAMNLNNPPTIRQLRHSMRGVGDHGDIDGSDSEGEQRQPGCPGRITPEGILAFVNALPRMPLIPERNVMQKLWIARRFLDPHRGGIGIIGGRAGGGVKGKEKWPRWAVHIAETMKCRGMEFVLA